MGSEVIGMALFLIMLVMPLFKTQRKFSLLASALFFSGVCILKTSEAESPLSWLGAAFIGASMIILIFTIISQCKWMLKKRKPLN